MRLWARIFAKNCSGIQLLFWRHSTRNNLSKIYSGEQLHVKEEVTCYSVAVSNPRDSLKHLCTGQRWWKRAAARTGTTTTAATDADSAGRCIPAPGATVDRR